MKELLITTLATSSVDSLNPIGITQQFILQGMVKKPKHIWYFIVTTAIVNMIFGYLVYYGVMTLITNRIDYLLEHYGVIFDLLKLVIGLLVIFFSGKFLIKEISTRKKGNVANSEKDDEAKVRSKVRSVTPLALITVGIISTASELTSAVPYFAFLAVLVNYKLSFFTITLILVFYNIIYVLPFVILYFIYIISKNCFNKVYIFFKDRLKGFLEIVIPALFLVLGFLVLFDSIFNLRIL